MRFKRCLPTLALIVTVASILTPAAWAGGKYRVLYNFYGNYGVGGPNGGPPLAAPVLDASGNLDGPAGGGVGNSVYCDGPCGVVFKMRRGANGKWSESVALNSSTYFNFAASSSVLAFDGRGNLYGILGGDGAGPNWEWDGVRRLHDGKLYAFGLK
jgi:hypothetical protein